MIITLEKNKSTDNCFGITLGSFDGAEICELVGLLKKTSTSSLK